MTLAEWARRYADMGVPVFPLHAIRNGACTCGHQGCASPAKHPRTKHGLNEATCDEAAIDEWWRRWPSANIGLRTGVAFDALDIDGEPGRFAFRAWLADRAMPEAPTSRTQSGGWHVLFQPTGAGNRARMIDDVDWRGRGGYIVAPPSVGLRGAYQWLAGTNLSAIPRAPSFLVELVMPPKPPTQAITVRVIDRTSKYGQSALRNIIAELGRAAPGSRNNALNEAAYAAGRLCGSGLLDAGIVVRAITNAGVALGLTAHEVELTVKSGVLAGIRNPREVAR